MKRHIPDNVHLNGNKVSKSNPLTPVILSKELAQLRAVAETPLMAYEYA
ncbi:MAG: hypothetical protein WAL75_17630 [Terracidiphilus sp.]